MTCQTTLHPQMLVVFANGAIYDPMAKRKFYVILMKMLRQRWIGVGWGGDVNVHVNLRHRRKLCI